MKKLNNGNFELVIPGFDDELEFIYIESQKLQFQIFIALEILIIQVITHICSISI